MHPHGSTEDRLDLFPLLAALPRQQRAVVVLRYYEDLSEREIADALGLLARLGEAARVPGAGHASRPARQPRVS